MKISSWNPPEAVVPLNLTATGRKVKEAEKRSKKQEARSKEELMPRIETRWGKMKICDTARHSNCRPCAI